MGEMNRVNFVLCWHMHQPWYQQGLDGEYQLPWVYLHAIKDYSDMAAHLENHPGMKSVVNFAPVLLEQLDDYAQQITRLLETGEKTNDPLLNLLAGAEDIPKELSKRCDLLRDCQRANAEKMIDAYPAFSKLLKPVRLLCSDKDVDLKTDGFLRYLNAQYFVDVLVWYHLVWLGYELKQTPVAHKLLNKKSLYSLADRRELLQLIGNCIEDLIPRYRRLAESGQVELSMTPYGHPIVPLLNDFDNMQCAQPDAPQPEAASYPGGPARARWHFERGIKIFKKYFGFRPDGVWLSEGAISEDSIALVEEYGFKWTASGEAVWRNSMNLPTDDAHKPSPSKRALFHSYQLKDYSPKIFFRDDGLSDLIGFEYAKRNSVEAAEDLVQNLVNIADFLGDAASRHVVTIILDGENAWEYYPHNGFYFLDRLYECLSGHDRIKASCFSDLIDFPICHDLQNMCPGSWVYGSFSTWIGQADKNYAWELLVAAKIAFDRVIEDGALDADEQDNAKKQLAIAEGSDWFWWFGDYNSSESVSDFDRLFRGQLKNLYVQLKLPIPDVLDKPVSVGSGNQENAGTMVRNS